MSKKSIQSEFEGLHYDILNDYITKGEAPENMEPEMLEYMEQLQFVQQRLHRVESPNNVIKSLVAFYPKLTVFTAKSRFNDALKFFYLDEDASKEAWNNYLFNLSMQAIELAAKSVDSPETALKIVDAILKAQAIKGLNKDDENTIDPKLLEEKYEIFTLKPSDVGLPEANRQAIAKQIDQMPLREEQKLRIKMDAGVEPRKLFTLDEPKQED